MFNFNDVTKNFEEANKMAEVNKEAFTKLFDINVNAAQKFFAFQSSLFNEGITANAENASKLAAVKSPKELEAFVAEVGKQVGSFSTETTSKVAKMYQDYGQEVGAVINETVKANNTAAQKAAKSATK